MAGITPDRFTFNALLEAHAAAGSLEGASKVYDTMAQRRIAPDICTFIALFQVCYNLPIVAAICMMHLLMCAADLVQDMGISRHTRPLLPSDTSEAPAKQDRCMQGSATHSCPNLTYCKTEGLSEWSSAARSNQSVGLHVSPCCRTAGLSCLGLARSLGNSRYLQNCWRSR